MADSMEQCKMLWADPCCHGNEIWARRGDPVAYRLVWMSVNTTTPEPLEILSRYFQSIILWSKGRISLKTAIVGCAGGENVSDVLVIN